MDKLLKFAIYFFVIAFFLLLVGTCGNEYIRHYNISKGAINLKSKLNEIDVSFTKITDDSALINDVVANNFTTKYFDTLNQLPYCFLVYKDNQIYYWNKGNVIPPLNILMNLQDGNNAAKFLNGYYYINKKTIFTNEHGYSFLSLYLLKSNFSIQNKYLQNELNAEFNLPNFLTISFDSSILAETIISKDGRKIFYLGLDKFLFNVTPNFILVAIYFVAAICLFLAIFFSSYFLLLKFGFLRAFIFLASSLFIVRFVSVYFNFPFELSKLDLYNPIYYASSLFNKSLADLLLNIFCGFILSYFFFRYAPNNFIQKPIANFHKTFLFLFYSLALLLSFLLGLLFQNLLTNSNIPFNLNNFLDLNVYSVLGILTLALAQFSYVLVFLKILFLINTNQKNSIHYPVLILAISINVLLFYYFKENYVYYAGAIWTIIFVLFLNDFRKQYEVGFPFTSLMLLITFFAVFSAIHIYKNNNSVEEQRKISFAKNIAQSDDPITEYLFIGIINKISNDRLIKNYFLKPFISKSDIIERLKSNYFEGYLNKYETRLYMLNNEGSMLLSDDKDVLELINNELLENARETGTENLFFIPRNNGSYCYLSNITITDNDKFIGSIVVILSPKVFYRTNLYPELLLEDHIKPSGNFQSLSFAEYSGNKLFNKSGNYPYNFKYNLSDTLLKNEFTKVEEGDLQHLIYRNDENKKIIISTSNKTFIQPITLFSYLFVIYLLFAGILVLLRLIKHLFETPKYFRRLLDISLKNRIQLSMIMMIIVSFLAVGIVTIFHFITQYDFNQKDRLLKKEEAIITDISYSIADNPNLLLKRNINALQTNTDKGTLNLSVLSEIHAIDINVFNPQGELINTSQPDIYEKGLFSEVMNPIAFRNLLYKSKIQFFQNENLGKLSFLALYAPIRNSNGDLLAYLNLPYFAKEKELKSEISSFLVTLINVYVLLLVFGGFLAYLLSDSITRSLSVLSERFKSIRLGVKNEPIRWKSNDEIGVLVSKYNAMIDELESSAELLAKGEREMAWREMAKQIAHEIKNPLTPMKLSIQMLQKAMKEGRQDVPQLSERVTKTLIEQIDNLSQIATSFSSFAKMPQTNMDTLALDDVIQSSVNLIFQQDDFEIIFHKPEAPVYIQGDKNQLLRAFGNLIKNAQQAIPDNRIGRMEISIQQLGKFVNVSFKDNGKGIPEDVQPRVFNPNFTTKSSGMGLGLAITKQIIEEGSNGAIWFETVIGEGTTFMVRFPLFIPSP